MNADEQVNVKGKAPQPRKEFLLLKDHRHKGKDLGVSAPVSLTAKQEQRLRKLEVI